MYMDGYVGGYVGRGIGATGIWRRWRWVRDKDSRI